MATPLLIEVDYDHTMTFVFENPTYYKASAATCDDQGWPESLEYTRLYLKGDPNKNDLTELFEEKSRYMLEEKVMRQFREP